MWLWRSYQGDRGARRGCAQRLHGGSDQFVQFCKCLFWRTLSPTMKWTSPPNFHLPRRQDGRRLSEWYSFYCPLSILAFYRNFSLHFDFRIAVYTVSVTFFRPNVIKFKFGGVKAPGVKSSKGKEVDIIVETDVDTKIISLSRIDLIANKCLHQKLQ